jgi:3'5'-cyclic nucleotide phosphodiesterase
VLFASPPASGDALAALFDIWRKDPPSTAAVISVAAETLGIGPATPALKAALMAGIAADVDPGHAYHNTSHFREVVSSMARLLTVNNEIASTGATGAELLDGPDMAKCLLAAAAHDLLHDGTNNTAGGVHTRYRLEDKAIAAAEPLMALAGMKPRDIEDVRVMVRVTDISKDSAGFSPHELLRQSYAVTFEDIDVEKRLSAKELARLNKDDTLLLMAALMSDADLTPSAATNYDFSRRQTTLMNKENPAIADTDASLAGFLKHMVGGSFTSAAGKKAGQTALDTIYKDTLAKVPQKDPKSAPKSDTKAP